MVDIQENRDLVNQFRDVNLALEVFDFADLTSTVTSLPSGQRVKLTGIVGEGIAQIREPVIGWVKAANLRFARGKSFTVNATNAPSGLLAFSMPGQVSQNDGPAGGATVFLTVPEDSFDAPSSTTGTNNTFVRVIFTDKNGDDRIGFVSQGPVGSTMGGNDSNFQ